MSSKFKNFNKNNNRPNSTSIISITNKKSLVKGD